MATSVIQTSFAGGELSTDLYARVDLDKYRSGAALLSNFFVDYRGGVSNRAGTEFVDYGGSDSEAGLRLIPFVFSRDQSYFLAFSENLITVYSNKVLVTTVVSPYLKEDLFALKYVQSADVLTITHPAYPIYNLSRTGIATFVLAEQVISPAIGGASALAAFPSAAGTYLYGYTVTMISETGEESLYALPVVARSQILDPTQGRVVALGFSGPLSGPRVVAVNVYKWGPVPDGQPLPTVFGFIGQSVTATFTDNNIAPDFAKTPPDFRDPFSPGQVVDIGVTAGGAGYSDYTELTITGDGIGAKAYAIAHGGVIAGVVVSISGLDYTTATATQIGGSAGAGATFVVELDLNAHYPAAVGYVQQRRTYGGADLSPELIEMSQIGHYSNHDISPSVLDTDAITANIASREVNTIKHLIPMSTGLIVFTQGMPFLLTGEGGSGPITPTNISAQPQSGNGCADLPPIVVNYNILFPQYQGSTIRDLAFNFGTQSYQGADRTMLANHLVAGFDLLDWAWAEEPFKLLWVVRNDGRCITMAYVPDQEVYGWSRMETYGRFATVCSVPEGNENAVYFGVRRYVPGMAFSGPAPILMTEISQFVGVEDSNTVVAHDIGVVDWERKQMIWVNAADGSLVASSIVDGSFIRASVPYGTLFEGIHAITLDKDYLYVGFQASGSTMAIQTYSLGTLAFVSATIIGAPADQPSEMGTTQSVGGPRIVLECDQGGVSGFGLSVRGANVTSGIDLGVIMAPASLGTIKFSSSRTPGLLWGLNCPAFRPGSYASNINLYKFTISGASVGFALLSSFTYTDFDGSATGFGDCDGPILDETDGHLICYIATDIGSHYVKFHKNTGAIIWSISAVGLPWNRGAGVYSVMHQCNRLQNSRVVALNNAATLRQIINTSAGTSTTEAITGVQPYYQCYNDETGHYIVRGVYVPDGPGGTAPDPINFTSGSGWGSSDQKWAFLGPVRFPSPGHWNTYIERLSTRPADCCPQLGVFLDAATYNATTPGAFAIQPVINGDQATLTAIDTGSWGSLSAGDFILYGCWTFEFVSAASTVATVNVIASGNNFVNESLGLVVPAQVGEWSYNPPITSLTAAQLEGQPVTLFCDGSVVDTWEAFDEAGNTATFTACARACLGIPFQSKFQTLRLEVEPTVQGRRKLIPSVTARLKCSAGLALGDDFDQPMYDYKPDQVLAGIAPTPFTGDQRVNIDTTWDEKGVICAIQTWPYATSILGIIPEVTLGDNQR